LRLRSLCSAENVAMLISLDVMRRAHGLRILR
jgi:hypothetical protein